MVRVSLVWQLFYTVPLICGMLAAINRTSITAPSLSAKFSINGLSVPPAIGATKNINYPNSH